MKSITSNTGFNKTMHPGIKYTLGLIRELHDGQTDHNGKSYVAHPIRVARNVKTLDPQASDDVVMAAMLHDTIEDCGIDEKYLSQKDYSAACIAIVSIVTKPENDRRSYAQVIDDVISSGNRGAMLVKLADNMDNLHPERVADLTQKNPEKAERLGKRYHTSIGKLCAALRITTENVYSLINDAPKLGTAEVMPSQQWEKAKVKYQYFLLGESVPVRVAFNDKGLRKGAEVPNREKGELVQDATYLSRLVYSMEVEEITEEQFREKAETMLGKSLE